MGGYVQSMGTASRGAAALWSGVFLPELRALGSAPLARSVSAQAGAPAAAAQWRGVVRSECGHRRLRVFREKRPDALVVVEGAGGEDVVVRAVLEE